MTTFQPSSIPSPSVAIVRRQGEKEQKFIIKVIEGPDYEETEIHCSLASIADPKNHTMKIIEVLKVKTIKFLFFHSTNLSALSKANLKLPSQALSVSNCSKLSASCTVKALGFRGTTSWVAPEVGENEGPKQTFEPIPVHPWATGSIILRFFGAFLPAGHQLFKLAGQLTSPDPRARPRLPATGNLKMRPIESHNLPLSKHIRRDYSQHTRLEYTRLQPFEQTSVR
ncbi:hypothetical protein BT69DRAFT_1287961 [Atractiella rhizophila]|nr:hypothetical protein BT69DRAFT_1287961 [Atractiella rhizophila]